MAKGKPRQRNYAAEYARRVAKGRKQGKTKQQARGHKPREHVARAEREREEYGITTREMRVVRDWCNKYRSRDVDCSDMVEEAQSNGYEWFKNYRHIWDAARRQYEKEIKARTWESRGMGYLEDLAARAEVPEVKWMYYH